jgi:hypothetical protein
MTYKFYSQQCSLLQQQRACVPCETASNRSTREGSWAGLPRPIRLTAPGVCPKDRFNADCKR